MSRDNNYVDENREEWLQAKKLRKEKRDIKDSKYDAKFLVRYGEIALKKANRGFFEKGLVNDIRRHLKELSVDDYSIDKLPGRIYISYLQKDEDMFIEVLSSVFGIASFSKAIKCDLDFTQIADESIKRLRSVENQRKNRNEKLSFKVECNRSNKGFEYTSPQVCTMLGGALLKNVDNISVDVHNPEIIIHVDIREYAYVYTDIYEGMRGMPYGSSGKAMGLISGGIDSPVASFLMARRGLRLELVHFHSYPFTSERAQEKVYDLVRKITKYTGSIKLHSVNLLEIQKSIMEKCPRDEMTILSRRFMMKIATKFAQKRKCSGLITGESLGQVASQTIESLGVTNAATHFPVFRPLIGTDKIDIIKIAKQIDTYDISTLPFEDCCTVFLPDKVVIKPRLKDILISEAKLDEELLINEAIENSTSIWISSNEELEF